MVFCGSSAAIERKSGTNVAYTSSVSTIRSGRFVFTSDTSRSWLGASIASDGGLLGLTRKNAFTFGSASLSSSESGYCQVWMPSWISTPRRASSREVFEVGDLEVGREDRRPHA